MHLVDDVRGWFKSHWVEAILLGGAAWLVQQQWSTRGQIHKVETNALRELGALHTTLTDEGAQFEKRVGEVEKALTEKIDDVGRTTLERSGQVEKALTEQGARLETQLADVDKALSARLAGVERAALERISQVDKALIDRIDAKTQRLEDRLTEIDKTLVEVRTRVAAIQLNQSIRAAIVTAKPRPIEGVEGPHRTRVYVADFHARKAALFELDLTDPKDPQFMNRVLGLALQVDPTPISFDELAALVNGAPPRVTAAAWTRCSFALNTTEGDLTVLAETILGSPVRKPELTADPATIRGLLDELEQNPFPYGLEPAESP